MRPPRARISSASMPAVRPASSKANGGSAEAMQAVSFPEATSFKVLAWVGRDVTWVVLLLADPGPDFLWEHAPARRRPMTARTVRVCRRLLIPLFYRRDPCTGGTSVTPHGRWSMNTHVRRWIEVGPHACNAIL